MDSQQMSLFILGLVLVIGTQSGAALQCHVCNSGEKDQGDCWHIEKGSNDFKINCEDLNTKYDTNHTYTMCRKQYQKVEGDKRIIRDCAIDGIDSCRQRTGTHKIRLTYCECFGDGCNSASATYISLVTMLVSIVMATLVTRS